jgi:hypothetical protein
MCAIIFHVLRLEIVGLRYGGYTGHRAVSFWMIQGEESDIVTMAGKVADGSYEEFATRKQSHVENAVMRLHDFTGLDPWLIPPPIIFKRYRAGNELLCFEIGDLERISECGS